MAPVPLRSREPRLTSSRYGRYPDSAISSRISRSLPNLWQQMEGSAADPRSMVIVLWTWRCNPQISGPIRLHKPAVFS
jgi:hypothetical protein